MKVSQVKENLGKMVLHKPNWSDKEQEFLLNAYIFRVDPRNPEKRIHTLELQDNNVNRCVYIVNMNSVKIKEISEVQEVLETKVPMPEKTKLAIQKLKENLKSEGVQ